MKRPLSSAFPERKKGIMELHGSAYSFKQLQIFLTECYTLLSVNSSSVCTKKSKKKSFIHDSQHPKDPPFLTGSDSQDSRRYYQTHGWLCPTGANSLKSLPQLPVSFPQQQQYAGEWGKRAATICKHLQNTAVMSATLWIGSTTRLGERSAVGWWT